VSSVARFARSLTGTGYARLSDDQAHSTFRALRWHETGGEPVCPACGCVACYEYRTRQLFKCKGCGKQFSVTSGTTFHGRKLPMRDYLMALAIFAINPKYMQILWTDPLGRIMIAIGLVSMAFGAMIIRKIVAFKG